MRDLIFLLLLVIGPLCAKEAVILEPVVVNKRDIAAAQRGAGLYFHYCSGCHSLKQIRYSDIARDLKILNPQGEIDHEAIFKYLNHVSDKAYDPVLVSLDPDLAQQWLGKTPPDLSLVARSRGPSWVAGFLKGFTLDQTRPWGVNNTVMPNTAMPHALIDIQGQDEHGNLKSSHGPAYEAAVSDLVSFLSYVGEPRALEREILGKYVLLFLALMVLVSYLYYKALWAELPKDKS